MKGRNIKLENRVFRKRTGITAFSFNDCFLKISMETKNLRHFCEIKKALQNAGYKVMSEYNREEPKE